MIERIFGIDCIVEKVRDGDGRTCEQFTFTVPGWEQCSIIGRRNAKRVIDGRLDTAVRNTLGID